jgi:hypothetical protein
MTDANDQFDLPPRMVGALRDGFAHRAQIPASVDAAILDAARVRFDRRRRLRMRIRWAGGLAAGLAAVIVLAISLQRPPAAKAVAKGDVNADGQLNIVDALALAKRLAARDKIDSASDVNGDGAIDQKDVDAIAAASVNLKQGGLARRSLPRFDELGIARGDATDATACLTQVSKPADEARAFAAAHRTGTTAEARQ